VRKVTDLETWLWDNLKPGESDSGHQTYSNLVWQGDGKLPVINVPLNLREATHFADEALVQEFVAQVRDAQEVLDIGPGDGWPSLRIAPYVHAVTGIEPSPRRVEVCRANAERLKVTNVKFLQMSAVEMNFSDASFDAVVAASSIEQTPNPMQVLNEVFRVLKPGGRFSVKFESLDVSLTSPKTESVALREHPDGALGWHYCLKHLDPPWERDYLVKYNPSPEALAAFNQARELVERSGDNPARVKGIGSEFLDSTRNLISGSSYYELEHFTTRTMIETLKDIGFKDVRATYSAGKLARLAFPLLNISEMTDQQLSNLAQALGQIAASLPAPLDQGQPVTARKPEA
jgi:SAM-dependent methyltransferase